MGHPTINPLLEFESEEKPPEPSTPSVASTPPALSTPAVTSGTGRVILAVIAAALVMLFLGLASNQTAATAAPSRTAARASGSARPILPEPTLAVTYPALISPDDASPMPVAAPYVLLGGTSANAARIIVASMSSVGPRRMDATGTSTWIAAVPLEPGSNTIEITARSSTGGVTKREVVVRRP